MAGPRRAGGGGGRRWSRWFLGRNREAAGGWKAPASTGEASGGLSAGGGGLDVAAQGDPKLTGEMGWAAEVGGARASWASKLSGQMKRGGATGAIEPKRGGRIGMLA
jgi:hypothetical protein